MKVETYEEALDLLSISHSDTAKAMIKDLEREGHQQKGICYAMWKGHEKIIKFKGDPRFWSIFKNEVRKWSWAKGDHRWKEYNHSKNVR